MTTTSKPTLKRALISCTDKSGLIELGRFLITQNFEILSTGGTAKLFRDNQIAATEVSDFTKSPEILEGRVKTLHPKIHGGLLGKRDSDLHKKQMDENSILPIDLVIVNLYAFEDTVAKGAKLEELIENIDIGGPSMLRSAAKNHHDVMVVVDPKDYSELMNEINSQNGPSLEFKQRLALKVFETTSYYDAIIAKHLRKTILNQDEPLTANQAVPMSGATHLRYGENPHQAATFYLDPLNPWGLAKAKQLQGKELSYNNLLDLDSAYRCCVEFKEPACVIVKHLNPCGVAIADDLKTAFLKAKQSDPISCFGGIVALNQNVDKDTATSLSELFLEAIIAPSYSPEALTILSAKKNLRLMELKDFFYTPAQKDLRSVAGGILVQDADLGRITRDQIKVVSKNSPSETQWIDLEFAWKVVKHVKSNAIVIAKNGQTLGVGAGQMSRVDSVKISCQKAILHFGAETLKGAALASDAFFPFRDGVDEAIKNGVTSIIQPGGSVKDDDVIAAVNEQSTVMVLTGMRHFRH